MRYCDNCGGIAGVKRVVTNPDTKRQAELYFCSDECEEEKMAPLSTLIRAEKAAGRVC